METNNDRMNYSFSVKLQVKQYESVNVSFSYSSDVKEGETIDDAFNRISSYTENKVRAKAMEIMNKRR
jgi:hypothetical protein